MDAAAMSSMRATAHRLGGGLLLVGAVAWLVLSGLHGDLPGTGHERVEEALAPLWRPVHILTIVAIGVVASGLAMLGGNLVSPRAAVLGRAGGTIIVPSGAVLGVGYAIDGFVLSVLAEAHAAAPDPAAQAATVMQADLVLKVVGATSFSFQTLFGLAILLLGIATMISGEYPRWLCGLGAIGGAVWMLAGILLFSRLPGLGTWLLVIPVLPVAAWMLTIGWLAWQRGAMSGAATAA
jgi:hypothetical protein